MTPDQIAVWAGAGTAVCALLAGLWRAGRAAIRTAARLDDLADDWRGTPERPGVPARPGVLERIAGIEQCTERIAGRLTRVEEELHPNGGGSLRDAVNRVDARTARIAPDN
ncbi:hypothetical protein [Streptomyces sp. NBRC 109706]|uniref:hypothetical protein n=1 Tax=Streptomyces sp. NBRC 109706 TaxID=1550035 RepID=UPI000783D772|nr:hypothetical protein [Streptomyces sp. NBRC 109706]